MNLYTQLKATQQKRVNKYMEGCTFFAFTDKQFSEGLKQLNIEGKEGAIVSLGDTGGYILKEKVKGFMDILKQNRAEFERALADQDTGRQFAFDMFYTELANHEYSYTGNQWEALDALGITADDLKSSAMLQEALAEAKAEILRGNE